MGDERELLAKILSAGALTLLLSGSALAYIPQQHNIYAGHSNGHQGAQLSQQYAANSVPFGYNDTQVRTPWAVDPAK